jgi:hypothetical protein
MANLKGFPPSNTISPSVRFTEQDLTLGADAGVLSTQNIGLVGFCSKGPINKPTRVQSLSDLVVKFGHPNIKSRTGESTSYNPYLIWAAQLALNISNAVYIVRCAETDPVSQDYAMTAEANVKASGGLAYVVGNGMFNSTDKITFDKNRWFAWKLNGIQSSKMLMLEKTSTSASYPTGMTLTEIAAVLNLQLDAIVDGIEFSVVDNGVKKSLKLSTTWAYGVNSTIEIISVMDNLFGGTMGTGLDYNDTTGNNLLGLGTLMTHAFVNPTVNKYPNNSYTSAGNYDFTTASDLWFQVVVAGTNHIYDNAVQTFDLTAVLKGATRSASFILTQINNRLAQHNPSAGIILGGFKPVLNTISVADDSIKLESLHYGRDAKILVRASSPLAKVFGWSTVTQTGGPTTSFTCSAGTADCYKYPVLTGSSNANGEVSFTVLADSPGIEGNNTFVTVQNDASGNTFTLNIFVENPFTKQINQVEAWGKLTKTRTSPYYVETYINSKSNYIRIDDNTDTLAPPSGAIGATLPESGTYLSGGTDGVPSPTIGSTSTAYLTRRNDLLIGNPFQMSGIYAFSEPDQTNIDTVAVPGAVDEEVILALIDMCENYRQDCLAIIDPPNGLTPLEVVQWQNGASEVNSVRFNSDFGALFWPWVYMRDTYNGQDVLVPPSGAVLATIARNDVIGFPWLAPAGYTRGIVPGIIGVSNEPTLVEKDLMYGNSNAVNPIVKYNGVDDYMLWGQKTLQRAPSALDRINVRRMMFYVEKQIKALSRAILFEPHTEGTRAKFVQLATSVLENVKVNDGIYAYKVVCDTNLNTSDVIDRNELRAQIGVQPTRAVEFIFIEFSLHRTGSFSESTAVAT